LLDRIDVQLALEMTHRPSFVCLWALILFSCISETLSLSSLAQKSSVKDLLATHASAIESLQAAAAKTVSIEEKPYSNPVFFLRYCLDHPDDTTAAQESLEQALAWRTGGGKDLCTQAQAALVQATASDAWNNAPIVQAAPHQDKIASFLEGAVVTTTTNRGDLVYCIRAGGINDKALMQSASVVELADFFVYTKEINAAVCNDRSLASNQLLSVLTANDLQGAKLLGTSKDFTTALKQSSQQAATVYPNALAGPTLILNLPPLLKAVVAVFKPLFPPAVKARIRFADAPQLDLGNLSQPGAARDEFLQSMEEIVYQS